MPNPPDLLEHVTREAEQRLPPELRTPLLLHHPVQLGVGLLLSGRLAGYVARAQNDAKTPEDAAVQTVG